MALDISGLGVPLFNDLFFGAPLKLTHLDEIHDLMFSIYVPCLLSIFNVFVYVLT